MGKNKIRRFRENLTFANLLQPQFQQLWGTDHHLKGQWHQHFGNGNPIVLELGCGKGEYTVNLARRFPECNYIGVDIKGARMWRGAKEATERGMANVAFVRCRIEHIGSLFAPGEVSEIWITFPDPQPRASKASKRLTSSRFLSRYQHIIRPNGIVHLKTDSQALHSYTQALALENGLRVTACANDIHSTPGLDPLLGIQTHYEGLFRAQGVPITYLRFELNTATALKEPRLDPP